ncbi:carbamoyltransferase C-terminal domain-containing protein, partial [Streptomyces brasiliscabiei]|uniref:carbamoyltransferase C-terminal domain-containing protein n=1 Tax=Streptomyces brasiliscabiei TaxID=2736302 RepID=UPI0027DFB2E1
MARRPEHSPRSAAGPAGTGTGVPPRPRPGAVTPLDGTARVQGVAPGANERFHRRVAAFGERTGTPVLLNTSFNNNAEPI